MRNGFLRKNQSICSVVSVVDSNKNPFSGSREKRKLKDFIEKKDEKKETEYEIFRRSYNYSFSFSHSCFNQHKEYNKRIEIYFRELNDIDNPELKEFCTDELCNTLSREQSRYQIIIKNLGRENFTTRLTLVEIGATWTHVKDNLIFSKSVALKDLNDFYKASGDIERKYNWGTKVIEFKFIGKNKEYPKNNLKIIIIDEKNNIVFETSDFSVLLKKSENEKKFWKRELIHSKNKLDTINQKKQEKKIDTSVLKKVYPNFPFCIFKPDVNRVITLKSLPKKNSNMKENKITGKKKKKGLFLMK